MATMMEPPRLEGAADSGFGVVLSGFHAATTEFAKKLAQHPVTSFSGIRSLFFRQVEMLGYVMLLVCDQEPRKAFHELGSYQMSTYRREPYLFFVDLPEFLQKRRVRFIHDFQLTESYGAITLTLLYQAAPDA